MYTVAKLDLCNKLQEVSDSLTVLLLYDIT